MKQARNMRERGRRERESITSKLHYIKITVTIVYILQFERAVIS
jgi:hypothetical protein